jgi:hypothetical protein
MPVIGLGSYLHIFSGEPNQHKAYELLLTLYIIFYWPILALLRKGVAPYTIAAIVNPYQILLTDAGCIRLALIPSRPPSDESVSVIYIVSFQSVLAI